MKLGKLLLVLLIPVLFAGKTAPAAELCIAIDGSGSIDLADFNIQVEGLAAAIQDPTVVPQNSTVILSVVQFSTSAVLEVAPTLIDSQTAADDVASQIREIYQQMGSTNISAAIKVCMNAFSDPLQKWIIDISTDGKPNYVDTECEALYNRDLAVLRGLDVLNALGIGNFVPNSLCDASFLEQLVWPQPASLLFEDGFVITIPDFAEYGDAIRLKLREEIECLPAIEVCNDLKDNDCDGMTDCNDPDCTGNPACIVCVPEVCNDQKDNDCDGMTDCNDPDCTGNPSCTPSEDKIVSIDIKPGSCPNPMRIKCIGVLPAAILGTDEFDVTTINPETVMITREGVDGGVPSIRHCYEDVGTPFEGELCECHCLRKDGSVDLALKFKVSEMVDVLKLYELGDRETVRLTIVGETYDGTIIRGQDCIRIIRIIQRECRSDLDCDADVDGSDAAMFKEEYGRRNCSNNNFCIADLYSDGDVDGSDGFTFKSEFGTLMLW